LARLSGLRPARTNSINCWRNAGGYILRGFGIGTPFPIKGGVSTKPGQLQSAKVPLLVLQGDNDPRVPREEAQQVVDLLKKDGRTVDVHYYPNEGHGFLKRENQIDAMRRTIDWFDKYLKAQP
jgi:predicted esterase